MAALLGPTASGKSAVATIVARRFGAQIVSVDSMQVYRGMDIGTAKPTPAERQEIPHHLIDIADPSDVVTVSDVQELGRRVLDDACGRPVMIVGGSGLHFRSIVDPLEFPPSDAGVRGEIEALAPQEAVSELVAADPQVGEIVDLANPRRVVRALEVFRLTGVTPTARAATPEAAAVRAYEGAYPVVAVGIDPGDSLAGRVTFRFDAMLDAGLLAEVAALAERLGPTARNAVGYRQLIPVVSGDRSLDDGRRRSIDATTSLARRQRTFFRRDPRIRWLEWEDDAVRLADEATRLFEEAGWTS